MSVVDDDTKLQAQACSVLFSVLAQALLNEPSSRVFDDMKTVAHALGDSSFDAYSASKDMTQNYYDRFVVPSSAIYVPLIESAMRNMQETEQGRVYGQLDSSASDHVYRCYAAVGFDPRALDTDELIAIMCHFDSLGNELAFVAYLKAQEAAAKDSAQQQHSAELAERFVKEHLAKWLNRATRVMNETADDFYAKVCTLASDGLTSYFG